MMLWSFQFLSNESYSSYPIWFHFKLLFNDALKLLVSYWVEKYISFMLSFTRNVVDKLPSALDNSIVLHSSKSKLKNFYFWCRRGGGGWKVSVFICIILIGILMIILYYCWVLSSDTCNRYCNGTLTFIRFLHNLIPWSQPLWLLLEISSMQLIWFH